MFVRGLTSELSMPLTALCTHVPVSGPSRDVICCSGTSSSPLTSSVPNSAATCSPSLPPRFRIFVNFCGARNGATARRRMTVCWLGLLWPEPSLLRSLL